MRFAGLAGSGAGRRECHHVVGLQDADVSVLSRNRVVVDKGSFDHATKKGFSFDSINHETLQASVLASC